MVWGFHRLSILLLLALTGDVLSDGSHYPDEKYNRKQCVRRKNTIQYDNPICQRTSDGQFTDESTENCKNNFRKSECPEFNKGSCELCDISRPLNKFYFEKLHIGCCKLYYKAGGQTWAEIFYANQYTNGSSNLISGAIVEIRRNIIKTAAFGNRNQESWPNSVLDYYGEQGLLWIYLSPKLNEFSTNIPYKGVCRDGVSTVDSGCTTFLKYLNDSWHVSGSGIHFVNDIEPSKWEMASNASITYELDARCKNIIFKKKRTSACQVLYTRRAKFSYKTGDSASYTPVTRQHDSSFVFLDVQLFSSPDENDMRLRYAYLNNEPAEERDQIFSNGA